MNLKFLFLRIQKISLYQKKSNTILMLIINFHLNNFDFNTIYKISVNTYS